MFLVTIIAFITFGSIVQSAPLEDSDYPGLSLIRSGGISQQQQLLHSGTVPTQTLIRAEPQQLLKVVQQPRGLLVNQGLTLQQGNDELNYGPAQYEYQYAVEDAHTGDIKSHQEARNGDVTKGRYQLVDPDGYLRIVEYIVNAHDGFVANVRREPLGHSQALPVVQKKIVQQQVPFKQIVVPNVQQQQILLNSGQQQILAPHGFVGQGLQQIAGIKY